MAKKINKDLQEEVNKKLASMLGFVDEKNIITFDKAKGIILIGGERVSEERLTNLRSESEIFLQSDLWKILSGTITFMAYNQMFVKSQKYEDTLSGKMWLYHLDIQKKLMDTFKSYKKTVQKPPIAPNYNMV